MLDPMIAGAAMAMSSCLVVSKQLAPDAVPRHGGGPGLTSQRADSR
jgi:hypothetical protein